MSKMHNTKIEQTMRYHTKDRKQSNSLFLNKHFIASTATICIPRPTHKKDRNTYNFPVIALLLFFFRVFEYVCVLWWLFLQPTVFLSTIILCRAFVHFYIQLLFSSCLLLRHICYMALFVSFFSLEQMFNCRKYNFFSFLYAVVPINRNSS